jgi:very-short-patch-repair endonuclease
MNTPHLTHAKQLRNLQTTAEHRLWYYLRAHRFMGLKFRRQVPMGRYIADFVCNEYRLIVEVDGGQHATQLEYDKVRDEWFREIGYSVLRCWNNEVMENIEGVLRKIQCHVENVDANSLRLS